jgi:hypothetical protein
MESTVQDTIFYPSRQVPGLFSAHDLKLARGSQPEGTVPDAMIWFQATNKPSRFEQQVNLFSKRSSTNLEPERCQHHQRRSVADHKRKLTRQVKHATAKPA